MDFEPDAGTEEEEDVTEEEVAAIDGEEDEAATEEEAAPAEDPTGEPDALARITEIDKKLEGLRKHVARRMGEILGEDAAYYVEDPLSRWSGVPGWMPPIDVPPDVAGELYHLLGQHAPSDYQDDKHSRACPDCNGFGEVATGSKIIGQDRLPCVECSGLGWQPTDDARRAKAGTAANGLSASFPPVASEASAVPETPAEDDPRVVELRQMGYAVIPPMAALG